MEHFTFLSQTIPICKVEVETEWAAFRRVQWWTGLLQRNWKYLLRIMNDFLWRPRDDKNYLMRFGDFTTTGTWHIRCQVMILTVPIIISFHSVWVIFYPAADGRLATKGGGTDGAKQSSELSRAEGRRIDGLGVCRIWHQEDSSWIWLINHRSNFLWQNWSC